MTPELKRLIEEIKLRLKKEPNDYILEIPVYLLKDINDFYEKTPLASLYREIPDIPSGTDRSHYQFSIDKVIDILNKQGVIAKYIEFPKRVVVKLKSENLSELKFEKPKTVPYREFQEVVKEKEYFTNLYVKWKLIAFLVTAVFIMILAIIFFS